MAALFPAIGQWYQDVTPSSLFKVVAVDEKNSTIEVQYADGDLDEIELEAWGASNFRPAAAPEDGNGAYGFSAEEYWQEDYMAVDLGNPLEFIEPDPDLFQGFDEL